MVQIYIEDLSGHVEKEVTLKGWLFNKRSSGKIAFLILRDGSGIIQCVVSKSDISEETQVRQYRSAPRAEPSRW